MKYASNRRIFCAFSAFLSISECFSFSAAAVARTEVRRAKVLRTYNTHRF